MIGVHHLESMNDTFANAKSYNPKNLVIFFPQGFMNTSRFIGNAARIPCHETRNCSQGKASRNSFGITHLSPFRGHDCIQKIL